MESAAHALRSCANSGRLRYGIASLEASGGLPAVEAYFTFIPYETRRNRKQLPGTLLLHRISLVRCPQPRPRPTTTLHDGRAAATASAALSPPTHPAPVTGLLVHCTPQPAPGCAAEPNSLPPPASLLVAARGSGAAPLQHAMHTARSLQCPAAYRSAAVSFAHHSLGCATVETLWSVTHLTATASITAEPTANRRGRGEPLEDGGPRRWRSCSRVCVSPRA